MLPTFLIPAVLYFVDKSITKHRQQSEEAIQRVLLETEQASQRTLKLTETSANRLVKMAACYSVGVYLSIKLINFFLK